MQPEESIHSQYSPGPAFPPGPVAPVWHTVVLIAGIVLISLAGAEQTSRQAQVNRLQTYAFTAATEVLSNSPMLVWSNVRNEMTPWVMFW